MTQASDDSRVERSAAELADVQDLRAVMAGALGAQPVDVRALRHGAWNFVVSERRNGESPADVIHALTQLVDAAHLVPIETHREVTRKVILWCVEAYFSHLGDRAEEPLQRWHADWRRRLARNLSRPSYRAWDPLTWSDGAASDDPSDA